MGVKEGVYRAEFSSLGRKSGANLTVRNGKVEGRDSAFSIVGTCQVTGDAIQAQIEVRKFNIDDPNPNIFGNDEDDATFSGTVDGDIINLVGRGTMPFPEVRAKLTWIST